MTNSTPCPEAAIVELVELMDLPDFCQLLFINWAWCLWYGIFPFASLG